MLRRCIIVPVLDAPRTPDEEMKGVDLTNTAYLHVKEKDGYGALAHDWLTPRAPLIASRTSVVPFGSSLEGKQKTKPAPRPEKLQLN